MKIAIAMLVLGIMVVGGVIEQVKAEAFADGYWYGWNIARGKE